MTRPANDPQVRALQGRRAGIVSRSFADLVDLFVVVIFVLFLLVMVASVRALFVGELSFELPPLAARAPLFAVLLVAYLTYGWGLNGRTFGKLVLGLRVVGNGGEDISFARGLGRAVLYVVFSIGLFWAVVSRRNASVQDLALRTAVVYDWGFEPAAVARADARGSGADLSRAPPKA